MCRVFSIVVLIADTVNMEKYIINQEKLVKNPNWWRQTSCFLQSVEEFNFRPPKTKGGVLEPRPSEVQVQRTTGHARPPAPGGGVLPCNGLRGMCRWTGSHFHDSILTITGSSFRAFQKSY